ncbi:hypothetical protein DSO57_1034557 [Entomophthora muscae]|uniref:Uncharacterized protein n=1 Tax=Entomophthora muscae TaxID=34485 RepID=A0ACC2UL45_9FUNG|nr:hypothetical protein DSO57_1034557 [Entomophthora muscae]
MSSFIEVLREAELEQFYARKNLHSLIEKVKGLSKPKISANPTQRTYRSESISRGKQPVSRSIPPISKPSRQSEAQPRQSELRVKNKPSGRKSLNLDAYGVPIRSGADNSPLTCRLPKDLADKIRVCIRKRPLSAREKNRGEKDIVDILSRRSLVLNEPKVKVDMSKYIDSHKFIFDEAIDSNADNFSVYERTAKPLISHVFAGGKSTCFA